MQVVKKVNVTIEDEELIQLLIRVIKPRACASEGQERTLFWAFSNLVGISAQEAVRSGNKYARENGLPTITTEDFREWLPEILSQTFKEFLSLPSSPR